MSKPLNEWVKEIHEQAVQKGWWDKKRKPLEVHMLFVTEIAEASEAVRAGIPPICQFAATSPGMRTPNMKECWNEQLKPEG